jgi:hypothetical protein
LGRLREEAERLGALEYPGLAEGAEKEDAGVEIGIAFMAVKRMEALETTGMVEAKPPAKKSTDTLEAREMIPSGDSNTAMDWPLEKDFL